MDLEVQDTGCISITRVSNSKDLDEESILPSAAVPAPLPASIRVCGSISVFHSDLPTVLYTTSLSLSFFTVSPYSLYTVVQCSCS